jgi:hypothetical protein
LKSQGKSDLAITQELVQARKDWLDDERKKYEETVVISPGKNGMSKRFFQEEKKENDTTPGRDGAPVASPTTETKLIVSRDAVEARKRWLAEEAFGNNWQRPNIGVEGNARMLSTLSMQTKVGLKAVSEDEVNGLGPVSPRDALRLTLKETNTLKTAHTSECDEDLDDFGEMPVESNSPISNKKMNDNTIMGDSYDTNASEHENSDEIESQLNNEKTNQNSTTDESEKEGVVHADLPQAHTCEPSEIGKIHSGEQNLMNNFDKTHHCIQQDLMMAPTDERLGLSPNNPRLDEPVLRDETPPAVNRDDWKLVQSDSAPVDTPCLEVCSIM